MKVKLGENIPKKDYLREFLKDYELEINEEFTCVPVNRPLIFKGSIRQGVDGSLSIHTRDKRNNLSRLSNDECACFLTGRYFISHIETPTQYIGEQYFYVNPPKYANPVGHTSYKANSSDFAKKASGNFFFSEEHALKNVDKIRKEQGMIEYE